jgi:hypothetical protein
MMMMAKKKEGEGAGTVEGRTCCQERELEMAQRERFARLSDYWAPACGMG